MSCTCLNISFQKHVSSLSQHMIVLVHKCLHEVSHQHWVFPFQWHVLVPPKLLVRPSQSALKDIRTECLLVSPVKNLLFKRMKQHEDQAALNGRKTSHFAAEKREKIDQSHFTNTGQRQYNNLESPEKERNQCCTEQQTLNRSNKEENGSSW